MLSTTSSLVTLTLVVILVICLITIACCATVEPFTAAVTTATPIYPKNTCTSYQANPYSNNCDSYNVNKPIHLEHPLIVEGGGVKVKLQV